MIDLRFLVRSETRSDDNGSDDEVDEEKESGGCEPAGYGSK